MTTKIPVELSSTPGISDSSNATAITIDSSEQVGIGTTSPATTLHLDASGGAVMRLQRTSSNATNKLELSHDGTDGTITSTNDLILTATDIRPRTDLFVLNNAANNKNQIVVQSGSVKLFDDGAQKLITNSSGVEITGASDTILTLQGGASDANAKIHFENSSGTFRGMLSYDTDDNNLQFNVNDSERMRITSAGVLSIGDASPESGDASAPTSLYLQGGEANMIIKNTDASSSSQRQGIAFLNSSGTRVGTITITSSATGYATSSDYRLKENVTDMTNATTRLKELKPKRFNWIADETNTLVDGFLAHEVSNVVPEAILGEKDGAEMQAIDQSKLIPLLVKTIQELEARITTLEG